MDEALAKLINHSLPSIDAATAFLQAEIPDVVQQLLLWNTVYHGIRCVVGVGILLFLAHMLVHRTGRGERLKELDPETKGMYKRTLTHNEHGHETGGANVARLFVLMGSVAAGFLINIEWLMILVAPKVWLIEYAAALVK